MAEIAAKIMVELLSILALATKQIKDGRFSEVFSILKYYSWLNVTEKYAKKLLGEDDVVAVLQRLDRLTVEESRVTIAQTMEVVHGLVSNTKVVMDGAQRLHVRPACCV